MSFQLRLCQDKSGWISGINTNLEVFNFWKLALSSQKHLEPQPLKSDNPAVPDYHLQALRGEAVYLSLCSPVMYEMGVIMEPT